MRFILEVQSYGKLQEILKEWLDEDIRRKLYIIATTYMRCTEYVAVEKLHTLGERAMIRALEC